VPAPTRLIAHLDMDAFYASVEITRYPELAGRPLVIGGGSRHSPQTARDPRTGEVVRRFARLSAYAGRGVVTTATYEARALGVHSAMGLMKAAALAPDAILLPTDFEAYRAMSRRFKAAVRAIAPRIEDRGIDEIFIDLTGVVPVGVAFDSEADEWIVAREIARAIKRSVRDATGLSCSIAIAPNKLLAKIASDLDKPDGLTLLRPHDIATRIWPLPARRLPGVGPKSAARLDALGLRTVGDIARAEPAHLVRHFGAHGGTWLAQAAQGRDDRPLVTHSEPRSVSREQTFERDLSAIRDRAELGRLFADLCDGVAADLRRKRYAAGKVGIKLRFDDFRTVTRDQALAVPTQDPATLRRAAASCVRRVDLDRRIRLLGVRVASLVPVPGDAGAEAAAGTPSLFD